SSNSFGQPSYAFRLLELSTAPSLSFAAPTSVDVVDGQATAFRFTGVAAQRFGLTIQNNPTFRVTWQLLNAAGNVLPLSQTGNTLSALLLADGVYTLLVGALTVGETGNVTILPTLVDSPVVTKSGFNTIQSMSILPGGNATYQFTAPAGTRYIIDGLDTASQNLVIDFRAPDGTRIDAFDEVRDMPRFHPLFLPQSGTYTLTLFGNTPADSGSYNFRVLDLDTFATPLLLNTVVTETRAIGRETNIYAFNATAGDQLNFDALLGTFAIGIYDPFLNSPYAKGFFGAATTVDADGIVRITRTGRHYVVLHGEENASTSFSFNLQNLALAPNVALGVEAAGPVPANSSVVYRMNLMAGQRIRVDSLEQDADQVRLVILHAGGRTLFNDNFSNTDSGPPGVPFIVVPETDEYLIVISNGLAADADYRFKIDDLGVAPPLTFDADLQVTLDPGQSAVVYKIDATAGETIQFDNLGTSGQALIWQLTGPVNQTLGGHNDGLDFSAQVLSSGTHYLTISGRQNSGPLSMRFRATRTPGAVVPLTGFNTVVNLDVGLNETKTYTIQAPTGRLTYLNVRKSLFEIPSHTVTLNRGETYLLRDLAGASFAGAPDLTGSIITSTKPVAVFGGNRATFVPSQFFAADHLVEQLPPTRTWGRDFVTIPLDTDSTRGDLFRFLAQADDTELTINGIVVATIDRGEFYQQTIVGPAHIVSSRPILVAQYAYSQNYYRTDPGGNSSFTGDPLMMIVPPSEQFLASYTVATPVESAILGAQRFSRNFINIVAPAADVGLIELDGVAIATNQFSAIGNSGFFGAQIPIDLGTYQLAGPLPFGVFVYGFGAFDSYGYVGGQSLSSVAEVSSVVLTPANAAQQIGNIVRLTARVADNSGSPLKGVRVDFDVAGVHAQRGFGFSDDNGVVQFSYPGSVGGRDVVTASVGQLLDDSIIDWRADAVAPQLFVTAPLDGSSVAAGTTLVATGQAVADFPLATLDLISVNGVPLTSVDAAGNFFVSLFIGPGDNEFEFTAIDSNGLVGSTTITLTGTQSDPNSIDFTQFADVSGSFRQVYARSSFNQTNRTFLAETAIENIGQFPADVPLLVGLANISDPLVMVRHADGYAPDGVPYYDFSGLVPGRSLNPLGKTSFLSAEFFNPNQTQFTYDLIFLGKLNDAPEFTSLPPTEADLNREYRYDLQAIDPNNDTLTFELVEAPAGMTIGASTGQIRWTPDSTAIGLHTVDIRVTDNRLGVSSQRFTINARPTPNNRAPVFTTIPLSIAEVGAAYPYIAQAVDVDGDALVYRLVSGPVGMSIRSDTGAMTWIPAAGQLGSQPVVIEVSDSRGAAAQQSFTLFVTTPADNALPVILSTPPSAAKRSGFAYQVTASDSDGDQLTFSLLNGPSGMTMNSAGLVEWTPGVGQVTPVSVAIAVLDARGGRQTQSFTLSVFDNQDPSITSSPIQTAQVNTADAYQVTTSDADADALIYQLRRAPSGMTINQSSGLVQWNVTSSAYARESVTIAVSDGRGGTATQSFVIEVAGGQTSTFNLDPYFVSVPPLVASVGTTWLYTVEARDPENVAVTFDLPQAPRGMVIDALTGRMGWNPTADQAGPQAVVIRAIDHLRGVRLQSFQVIVDTANTSPSITSVPITNASPGNAWEYRVHAQDADGDALTFELGSPISGMTLTTLTNADSQAVLRFSPTVAGAVDVVLVAQDGRGGRTDQRFTIQVAPSANIAPEIQSQPRLSIPAGQPWVYLISAIDPNSDPVSLSLTAGPAGMELNTQMQLASWTPTLAQLGPHVFTLSASDNRGGSDTQTVTLTVVANSENDAPRITSLPPAFRARVGQSVVYDLHATDPDDDPVEWSLVEAPSGTSLDRRFGTLRWTPSIEHIGLQRFVISAKDPTGLAATQSFSLNVSGANFGPSILSRPPSEAVADASYVYGLWAVDPENDPLTFSLSSSPAGMTIDAARGIVRWTPTLAQLGIARATVEVADSQGNRSVQSFQINVSQVVPNRDPIITSRAIFRARVDAPYQYDVQAIDPEGSDVTYQLVSAPTGMQIDSASGLISWTPTAAQIGSHLVQVVAQDSAGGQSLQRFAILARVNQSPVINSTAPTSVAVGGLYQYDLRVSDPEGDRLSYQLVTGPAGMT
ncbi:MAG: putative Ig domain-containing protein, partial [Pirellulaceae bacterium]|nr:putative Ig domain-containing protein [Pirellulaceae bacterium]